MTTPNEELIALQRDSALVERDELEEHIKVLEAAYRESLDEVSQRNYDLRKENDTLRAQLVEIEKTEPVGDGYTTMVTIGDTPSTIEQKRIQVLGVNVFTRPMPADVTELVEALEMLIYLIDRNAPELSGQVVGYARTELSKYKGVK